MGIDFYGHAHHVRTFRELLLLANYFKWGVYLSTQPMTLASQALVFDVWQFFGCEECIFDNRCIGQLEWEVEDGSKKPFPITLIVLIKMYLRRQNEFPATNRLQDNKDSENDASVMSIYEFNLYYNSNYKAQFIKVISGVGLLLCLIYFHALSTHQMRTNLNVQSWIQVHPWLLHWSHKNPISPNFWLEFPILLEALNPTLQEISCLLLLSWSSLPSLLCFSYDEASLE